MNEDLPPRLIQTTDLPEVGNGGDAPILEPSGSRREHNEALRQRISARPNDAPSLKQIKDDKDFENQPNNPKEVKEDDDKNRKETQESKKEVKEYREKHDEDHANDPKTSGAERARAFEGLVARLATSIASLRDEP